ncbi:hypothetical protein EV714DRAFT_256148 [Schizophyllum commune]
MTTIKRALTDRAVHQAIMVKQAAYTARVPRGNHPHAQEVVKMFDAYIGVHCDSFGLARSQDLVKNIYLQPAVAACEGVKAWEATTGISLRGGFSNGDGDGYRSPSDAASAMKAALTALYATDLPPNSPELTLEFTATTEAHRWSRMALGQDAVHAMVVLQIAQFWEDISPAMLERVITIVLSQEFLHHIPHRLDPRQIRWPKKDDHLQVLFWFGCQALAGREQAMHGFVHEVIRPAVMALRGLYFPLYLPNARIPVDWSNRLVVNLSMQHMLLRYVENLALGLYVELNSDSRVEIFVEDAQRLLQTNSRHVVYHDLMGQIDNTSKLLEDAASEHELQNSPDDCLVVATVTGLQGDTCMQQIDIQQLVLLTLPLHVHATVFRLGASAGNQLDGSIILRIRRDSLFTLFEGQEAIDLYLSEGVFIHLDKEIRRGQCSARLLNFVHRSIDRTTLAQRGLSAYRDLLLPPPGPLLPKVGIRIPMPMFSGEELKVHSRAGRNAGYIPAAECPVVAGCAVQFRGNGYLGSDPMALFSRDDCAYLWDYALRLHDGGWTCSILFNGLVSDRFLNNLNVALPQLNGVDGQWVRMDSRAVQRWVVEVVQEKAEVHRFLDNGVRSVRSGARMDFLCN